MSETFIRTRTRKRDRSIRPNRMWNAEGMILPTLVVQVLTNAHGDRFHVYAHPDQTGDSRPEVLPAIRVRSKAAPWTHQGRMFGRLTVVTFTPDGIPPIIDPLTLVDPLTGDVLPEYMAGIPGVSLRLRALADEPVIRAGDPTKSSYSAVYWSAVATIGDAQ
ncbi:hypothetical protein ACIBEF_29235 [Micromonospora sp. NPDC050795]|uniref:hypothetical protein n=1 Tax=Micromonospora sp. NPDC050795 TaxID=3364282 RepID=UPI0037A4CA85